MRRRAALDGVQHGEGLALQRLARDGPHRAEPRPATLVVLVALRHRGGLGVEGRGQVRELHGDVPVHHEALQLLRRQGQRRGGVALGFGACGRCRGGWAAWGVSCRVGDRAQVRGEAAEAPGRAAAHGASALHSSAVFAAARGPQARWYCVTQCQGPRPPNTVGCSRGPSIDASKCLDMFFV